MERDYLFIVLLFATLGLFNKSINDSEISNYKKKIDFLELTHHLAH